MTKNIDRASASSSRPSWRGRVPGVIARRDGLIWREGSAEASPAHSSGDSSFDLHGDPHGCIEEEHAHNRNHNQKYNPEISRCYGVRKRKDQDMFTPEKANLHYCHIQHSVERGGSNISSIQRQKRTGLPLVPKLTLYSI